MVIINKEKEIKLYIAGGKCFSNYANWICNDDFYNKFTIDETSNIENANIVLLAGGSDISPDLYQENKHIKTSCSNISRDLEELVTINYAIKNNIPIIGICRGAQLLCVVAGGKIVQNMHHEFYHDIYWYNFTEKKMSGNASMHVNSMHHQLQYPYSISQEDYEILAYTHQIKTTEDIDIGDNSIISKSLIIKKGEPEIVWYKKIKGLAIQYHPEALNDDLSLLYTKKCLLNKILSLC
jgi:anthranilate/para-aminobenzoate synthase component II